jgi:hypothetical protein
MSTHRHTATVISAVTFGLFCVLVSSACDTPEDSDSSAMAADTDWADTPALPEAAPPNDFYIAEVTTNGKGCPNPDSVTILTSLDDSLVRILYDDMFLEHSSEQVVQTTSCTMTLDLHIPAGWRVAPRIVRTRGYAYLDKNIKARRNTNMFFAGVPVGVKFNTNLQGPTQGAYQANDVVPSAATVWSSCGGTALFSITNSLVLNGVANPDGEGLVLLQDQRLVSWQFKQC